MDLLKVALSVVISIGFIGTAYGAPGDLCFEQGGGDMCDFIDAPLEAMIVPFTAIFTEPVFITIVWGVILAILWLRTQSTMLVGVVAMIVLGGISVSLWEPARNIGYALFAVAIGVTLYQLFRHRLQEQTA